jgi:hypothetical protein
LVLEVRLLGFLWHRLDLLHLVVKVLGYPLVLEVPLLRHYLLVKVPDHLEHLQHLLVLVAMVLVNLWLPELPQDLLVLEVKLLVIL